jgi:hypothetical protein
MKDLSIILYGLYPIAKLIIFTIIFLIGAVRISYEISLHVIKLLDSKK